MAKAGSSFFMEPTMNPRAILRPFLGVLDVEIKEVGYADEGPACGIKTEDSASQMPFSKV